MLMVAAPASSVVRSCPMLTDDAHLLARGPAGWAGGAGSPVVRGGAKAPADVGLPLRNVRRDCSSWRAPSNDVLRRTAGARGEEEAEPSGGTSPRPGLPCSRDSASGRPPAGAPPLDARDCGRLPRGVGTSRGPAKAPPTPLPQLSASPTSPCVGDGEPGSGARLRRGCSLGLQCSASHHGRPAAAGLRPCMRLSSSASRRLLSLC